MWSVILSTFGLFLVWRVGIPICGALWRHLLLVHLLRSPDLSKFGKWAVVTGSTDGIGLAYARKLVSRGCNVLLISRSVKKLESVAAELRKHCRSGREVKYIAADLSQQDEIISVAEKLCNLEVGILVNNVGMTQPYPADLYDAPGPETFFPRMVYCNTLTAVLFTRAVLKGMMARKKGLLITIGSASGLLPIPMVAMYSASKRFLDIFTESIRLEVAHTGVHVHLVMPFYVKTKFIGAFDPPRLLTPNAEEYAEQALEMINVEPRTHGTLSHALQGAIVSNIPPDWLWMKFSHRISLKRREDTFRAMAEKKE